MGKFHFSVDAVIVEGWEILPFDKEKYWPITVFSDDEYVLFHCIAVAFEDSVPLTQEDLRKMREEKPDSKLKTFINKIFGTD